MGKEIWFWQGIISPHMASFVSALVKLGFDVTYVAEQEMTSDRVSLGWVAPEMPGVRLCFMKNKQSVISLIRNASPHSVHICDGIRGNGLIAVAQQALARRGLMQWVLMETVNDQGYIGKIKRLEYRRLFFLKGRSLAGVLATGHKTRDWVIARGFHASKVFSFAYFLPDITITEVVRQRNSGTFRFIFVGRLIPLKRIDLLIRALQGLVDREFELLIVGSGPQEQKLQKLAEQCLPGRVTWMGGKPLSEVLAIVAQADCLVLPSYNDGWGAVISEALMVGTPVVCSDTCGAACAVKASGSGGIFPVDNVAGLRGMLAEQLDAAPISMDRRLQLAKWATALGAEAGAKYLDKILQHAMGEGDYPEPPWNTKMLLHNC